MKETVKNEVKTDELNEDSKDINDPIEVQI